MNLKISAKLTQYINDSAFSTESELKIFINKQVEIEHILPQNPDPNIVSSFDKPGEIKKYIARLGNLGLVEKPINASVGNKSFEEKKKAYPKSKFLLIRTIAEKVSVGTNTAIDRAVQGLGTYATWTSQSIEDRQKTMTQLAKKVWDIPE